MNAGILFQILNLSVLPFWALMIFLPHWRWTKRIISSPWVASPPAAIYAVLVLPQIGSILPALSQPSAENLAALMSDPLAVTIGWAHYLAFDLFTGRWVYLDSREKNLSAWITGVILALVFMLGPLGWLVYLLWQAVRAKTQ